MKVSIDEKKGEITMTLPMASDPKPSNTQKTLSLAGTGGFVDTGVDHPKFGRIKASININVPNPNRPDKKARD